MRLFYWIVCSSSFSIFGYNISSFDIIYSMAIQPQCDMCKKELTEFGAIILSPPVENQVTKYHVCIACYQKIVKLLDA